MQIFGRNVLNQTAFSNTSMRPEQEHSAPAHWPSVTDCSAISVGVTRIATRLAANAASSSEAVTSCVMYDVKSHVHGMAWLACQCSAWGPMPHVGERHCDLEDGRPASSPTTAGRLNTSGDRADRQNAHSQARHCVWVQRSSGALLACSQATETSS